jgi:cytoskeleton protein RodZ
MSSVGTYLRELRQRRGVSLAEIARTTRVAPRYLESLEADAFEALPSPVFTRGFIRAYCQALDQSPDEALAAYEVRDGRTPPPATARPSAPPRTTDADPRGRGAVLVSFVLLVVLGMALFAVALVIHPRERGERASAIGPTDSQTARPPSAPAAPSMSTSASPSAPASAATTAPSPAAPGGPTARAAAPPAAAAVPPRVAAPASPPPPATPPMPGAGAPTPSPSSTPAPATSAPRPSAPPMTAVPSPAVSGPTPAAPSSAAPVLEGFSDTVSSPYRLVARTSETTWIRVRTEDGRTSEENVPAGEIREWVSNRPFIVSIGNAGGVSFELNGRALPSLGPKGLVIQRIVVPPEPR